MSANQHTRVNRLRSGDDCECHRCEEDAKWSIEANGKVEYLCQDHYDDYVEEQRTKQTA